MKTITLYGIHGNGKYALVDNDDYQKANQYKWTLSKTGYVVRSYSNGKRGTLKTDYLHRFILNTDKVVDHRNRNPLDNRKGNLRIATHSQNHANQAKRKTFSSSKFKGVSFHRKSGKWRAYICVNYRFIHLGMFTSQEEAARAYDIAAKKHFKSFALPNNPSTTTR